MKYIAKGKVHISKYGGESEYFEFCHVVNAEDDITAENKVRKFYDDKTEQYYAYYRVDEIEIFEELE